ncbi:MAG TPA: RNA pyrophosphohydrolase, partial [Rhizomicrobium sp.]
GEEPRQAAMRELKEEAGTGKAEIIGEMDDWITYDLPAHLVGVAFHGKFRGQRQKWFALRFTGSDSDIDLQAHEPEFSDWKWLALDELPRVIVPFKRDSYAKVIAAFRHLAKPA